MNLPFRPPVATPVVSAIVSFAALILSGVLVPAFPAAAANAAWTRVPAANALTPEGMLRSVSCSTGGHCTAVGQTTSLEGVTIPLIERWRPKESKWTTQRTALPTGGEGTLSAVSCPTDGFCMGVGTYQAQPGSIMKSFTESWNGAVWTAHDLTAPSEHTIAGTQAVSCISSTYCLAGVLAASVGYPYPPEYLAYKWNGSAWSPMANPPTPPGTTQASFTGMSCTGTAAQPYCMAVGTYTASTSSSMAAIWNGSTWTPTKPKTPSGGSIPQFNSVSCPKPGVCGAAGDFFDSNGYQEGLGEEWNGSGWSAQAISLFPDFSSMQSISCTALASCAAAGYVGGGGAWIAQWNGTSWAQPPTDPVTGQYPALYGVACPSAAKCAAVGWFTTAASANHTLVEGWDGKAWKRQVSANPKGALSTGLESTACDSTGATCMAVGGYSQDINTALPIAERWSGTKWERQKLNAADGYPDGLLHSVACPAPTSCVAVGEASTVGSTDQRLLIDTWNGSKWSATTMIPNNANFGRYPELTGVSCPAATSVCVAVGDYLSTSYQLAPVAEVWNGKSWSARQVPLPKNMTTARLQAVSCSSATSCVAVGSAFDTQNQSGGIAAWTWNGAAWSPTSPFDPPPAIRSSVSGIACPSGNYCVAVGMYVNSSGANPLIESWNGSSWTLGSAKVPHSDDGASLSGVSCVSGASCMAVGSQTSFDPARNADDTAPLSVALGSGSWVSVPVPHPDLSTWSGFLTGITCPAGPPSPECLAVGTATANLSVGGGEFAMQYR